MKSLIKEIAESFYGPHDFVPTCGGRGEHHPHGLVGTLWRIQNPETVRVGDCFMKDRLKKDDLWLGIAHTGDCFQDYIFIEEYSNCLIGQPKYRFGSYGIGDSIAVPLNDGEFEILKSGGRVERR